MDAKKKRFSKATLRAMAWAAGAVTFAVPWVAFHFVPVATSAQATAPQVVVVPAGSKIVVLGAPAGTSGVKIITSKATTSTSVSTAKAGPVATTGASAPPP
jgi:hypothetical protein